MIETLSLVCIITNYTVKNGTVVLVCDKSPSVAYIRMNAQLAGFCRRGNARPISEYLQAGDNCWEH